jgi:hypothetical protein
MVSNGVSEPEICLLIKNPETDKPIDLETLRKYFADEIAIGAAKMKLRISKFIFATILGHEGGLADDKARGRLLLAFAKARLGWNEEVGDPIVAKDVQQKLTDKLYELAQRMMTGKKLAIFKA